MNWPARIFCLLLLGVVSAHTYAEPASGSPEATVTQVVGESEIHIDYSRPGVRGRKIWGDLVPFGKVWRAGANDKTAIKFEEDVIIAGKQLPQGTYALYAIPTEWDWTLILNSDWEGHGTDHNTDADVHRFTVTPTQAPHEEWLRYGFDKLEDNAAEIYLQWETKKVSFRFEYAAE